MPIAGADACINTGRVARQCITCLCTLHGLPWCSAVQWYGIICTIQHSWILLSTAIILPFSTLRIILGIATQYSSLRLGGHLLTYSSCGIALPCAWLRICRVETLCARISVCCIVALCVRVAYSCIAVFSALFSCAVSLCFTLYG